MRLFGLSGSGLDVDEIVSQLMRAERVPLDRLYQKRQLAEWKRDEYRNITNLLRSFKDEYFNNLKMASNMLSQSTYRKFVGKSSDESVITVSGNANAAAGSYTVLVKEIAAAAVSRSSGEITKKLVGSSAVNVDSAKGKSISLEIDGIRKTITIGSDVTDLTELVQSLQSSIDEQFGLIDGESKVQVSIVNVDGSDRIAFIPNSEKGVHKIAIYSGPSETSDALNHLGFTGYASNRLSTGDTLEAVSAKLNNPFSFNENGKIELIINNKRFEFDKSTTLSSMMNKINSDPDANVIMQYDEISDRFVITAKQLGSGSTIQLSENGSTFLEAVGLDNPDYTAGKDACIVLNGTQTIVRSSNSFTINGITYNLHKKSDQVQTVTLEQDVQGVLDNIKKFIEKYNEIIDAINKKLDEKYDRNFLPLTDEQKKEMKEDDIRRWEEKAKTGLLRNDSIFQNIVNDMRRALSDAIEGVSLTLSSIGITTGSYSDKGKLKIDEEKLKAAIENNPEGVMELFAKKSSIDRNIDLTPEERAKRYNEQGIAYRIFDVIENNIRTIRDKDGRKGILLEMAGMEGDSSDIKNLMYNEIKEYNEEISKLAKKLYQKEELYYLKYAQLEKAITSMLSQGNYLLSQFMQQ